MRNSGKKIGRERLGIARRSLLVSLPGGFLAAQHGREGGAGSRPRRLPTSFVGAQFYDEQERSELAEALESRSLFRWYGPGTPNKVAQFEAELARAMGVKYALAVTSGTAALHVALTALAVGPGDEVILPAWGWYSCYNAILLTGALPVFAENDESLNLDPADLERKITSRTRAVMVVHLHGGPTIWTLYWRSRGGAT